MAPLHLTLHDEDHELPDHVAHYLWAESNRLHVAAQRPPSWSTTGLGCFLPLLGTWWFHSTVASSPRPLRFDG